MAAHGFRREFAVVNHSQPVETILQRLLRLLQSFLFPRGHGVAFDLIDGQSAEAAEGTEVNFLAAVFKVIVDHRQFTESHLRGDLDEKGRFARFGSAPNDVDAVNATQCLIQLGKAAGQVTVGLTRFLC